MVASSSSLTWLELLLPAVTAARGVVQQRNASLPSVRWYAPFFSGGGYSSEATAFVGALAERVEVTIEQHGDSYDADYVQGSRGGSAFETVLALARRRRSSSSRADVAVCHSEPGAWHVLEGPAWPSSRCPDREAYVVGRTMFETDRLPDGWPRRLNAVDEVWVPTAFHRRIFEAAGVKQVRVVGEPVDVDQFTPEGPSFFTKSSEGDDRPGFVVASVFKWEPRKGWDVLLRGWHGAFSSGGKCVAADTTLILVTNAYHSAEAEASYEARLDAFARSDLGEAAGLEALCPIRVLTRLTQPRLEALLRSVSLVALPTRGEGWGRPHVEAMASGTPVVATNWSGPTAFLTEANGYPLAIHADLDPIRDGAFKGHRWANPDADHLAMLLRDARDDPETRRAKGRRARRDMVQHFSPTALADLLETELARIATILDARGGGGGTQVQGGPPPPPPPPLPRERQSAVSDL